MINPNLKSKVLPLLLSFILLTIVIGQGSSPSTIQAASASSPVITPLQASGLTPIWEENFTDGLVDRGQYTWARSYNDALTSHVIPGAIYIGHERGEEWGWAWAEQQFNFFKSYDGEPPPITLEFDLLSPMTGQNRISLRKRRNQGEFIHLRFGEKENETQTHVTFKPLSGSGYPVQHIYYNERTGPDYGWAHVTISCQHYEENGELYLHCVLAVNDEVQEFSGQTFWSGPPWLEYWAETEDAFGWSVEYLSKEDKFGKYLANFRAYDQYLTREEMESRLQQVDVDAYRQTLPDLTQYDGPTKPFQQHKILDTFAVNPLVYAEETADPLTVRFDGSLSSSWKRIENYEWSFGDGTTATGPIVTHTYAEPGNYEVALTTSSQYYDSESHIPTVEVTSSNPIPPPRGQWSLDETSGVRQDSSGLGNHLPPHNGVGSAQGQVGQAADLETGADQYLSIEDAAQTGLDIDGSLTLAGWMKAESLDRWQVLASKFEWGVHNRAYRLGLQPNNIIELFVSPDGTSKSRYKLRTSPPFTLVPDQWYHVAGVFDAQQQTLALYLDGDLIDSRSVNHNTVFNSSAPFMLGANLKSGQINQTFDGLLDEWYVFASPLSEIEIETLMTGGQPLPIPTTTPTPTPTSTPPTPTPTPTSTPPTPTPTSTPTSTTITPLQTSGLTPIWEENFTDGSVDRGQYTWARGYNDALTSHVIPGVVHIGHERGEEWDKPWAEQQFNFFKSYEGEPPPITLEFDVFSPMAGHNRISLRKRRKQGEFIHLRFGETEDETQTHVEFKPMTGSTPRQHIYYDERTGPGHGWAHVTISCQHYEENQELYFRCALAVNDEVQEFSGQTLWSGPPWLEYWAETDNAFGWSVEYLSKEDEMVRYLANFRAYDQYLTKAEMESRLQQVDVDAYRQALPDPTQYNGPTKPFQQHKILETFAVNALAYAGETADPLTVKFDGSLSSSWLRIENYEWSFGDGATATGPIVTHTYTEPGTYDVVLTTSSQYYGSESHTLTINVTGQNLEATPLTMTTPSSDDTEARIATLMAASQKFAGDHIDVFIEDFENKDTEDEDDETTTDQDIDRNVDYDTVLHLPIIVSN